jgi:predicted metalloprotease with PDZ domain
LPDLDFLLTPVPAASEVLVSLELEASNRSGTGGELTLFLPTWTPGSYLVREFSRHLSQVQAEDAASGAPLACTKTSKNRFAVRCSASTSRVRIRYRVYAHDLTVRTADVTGEHAFWNHTCLLLWPIEGDGLTARITVELPDGWDFACALQTTEPAGRASTGTHRVGLLAENMERAYDAPFLAGRLLRQRWESRGVEHEVVLDGVATVPVPEKLLGDLQRVVESAAAVFQAPLPYKRYSFLCLFTADGHGGLEHSDSTVLLAARTSLHSERGYREFLALAAHELFHAWNVKRMRPVEFWRYDYENENYTRLLWLLEGWTAYYDDLLCFRAGLMSRVDYLGILAKSIQTLSGNPGRLRLSLADSSYDAWIRLYRPDENTRNSSQNYYVNGSIAAMCMDLQVRLHTRGRRSLDDVLRRLFATTYGAGRGFEEVDVWAAFAAETDEALAQQVRALVTGGFDPELVPLLLAVGVKLETREAERPYLGLQFDSGQTTVASVTVGSPASAAGLQAGDEILAIDSLRVDSSRWQEVFQAVARVDQPLQVLIARRGVVQTRTATPANGPGTVSLAIDDKANAEAAALREAWLPAPAAPAKT